MGNTDLTRRAEPALTHSGGVRGWIGDSPCILLDRRAIRALGWVPRLSIRQAVARTVEYLQANPWMLELHT